MSLLGRSRVEAQNYAIICSLSSSILFMKKIQNWTALIFIGAVAILTAISILGVWSVLGVDVIEKSFSTLGLLFLVAIIVLIAGRFIDGGHKDESQIPVPAVSLPVFTNIRKVTIAILIASASILALFGVLAIWDVLAGSVMAKTIGSLVVLAFSTLIVVMTCLEREGTNRFKLSSGQLITGIILLIIIGWIVMLGVLTS